MKEKNKENKCDECGEEVEEKFNLGNGVGYYNEFATKICQCPKCKNIQTR